MLMIRIAVVGCGYWGPNLIRNFTDATESTVARVCDLAPERLERIKSRYPWIETSTVTEDVIRAPDVDAVVIATPVSTHFDLAMMALREGKHVLIEKPMAENSAQCSKLIETAEANRLTLLVDHTFVYTAAVQKIRDLITEGELGELYYYDSVRVNLGLFQHDVSVVWDLAVHDIAIMDFLLQKQPEAISATGISHVVGQPDNVAYVTFFFPDSLIAHVHVNWLAPAKIRQTLIGGSKRMVVYDSLQPAEPIRVYDKGVQIETDVESIHRMKISYRVGDMWAPKLDNTEALAILARHFCNCVAGREEPITPGLAGLRVVTALEAAEASIRQQGAPVSLYPLGTRP